MNIKKKKNLIIFILCLVLIVMATGYAVLSQTLIIKGVGRIKNSWKVYIETITPTTSGEAVSTKNEVSEDGLSAYFAATIDNVSDFVEYTVHIVNKGSISAELTTANLITESSNKYVLFEITNLDLIEKEYVIKPKESLDIIVKVTYLNELIGDSTLTTNAKLQLNFIQPDGVTHYTPSVTNFITASE